MKNYSELYPTECEFTWAFCRYFWESHVDLPEININDLEKIILRLRYSKALDSIYSEEQDEFNYIRELNKELNIQSLEEYADKVIKDKHKNYIENPEEYFKFKASKKGVTSLITSFRPEYQGQGIARNIYAYVRAMGNTIIPSRNQLPPGKAMWDSWKKSGEAQHLMRDA